MALSLKVGVPDTQLLQQQKQLGRASTEPCARLQWAVPPTAGRTTTALGWKLSKSSGMCVTGGKAAFALPDFVSRSLTAFTASSPSQHSGA